MTKMLQSGIGRVMLAAAVVAVAVFAAIALDRADADAQAGSVKSLSVGGGHACAITSANNVLCWGNNSEGQTEAPASGNFKSVAAGQDYTCGYSRFAKILDMTEEPCWGSVSPNTRHIIERIGGEPSGTNYHPELLGIGNYCRAFERRISSGLYRTVIASSGSNVYGQLDLGCSADPSSFVMGGWHSCRLSEGSIECVGRNDSGQTTVPSGRYISVDAGRAHTCAVTSYNRLQCWGEDVLGQSSPPVGSDYLEVSSNAFANFNCALTDERKVRCWGDNRYGQTNVPAAIAAPPPLQFTQPVEAIITRKNQPISPLVLPSASGGKGRLSYNIAHTRGDTRKKGTPTGLVFDETTRRLSGRPFDDAGYITLHYSVSDTSGRTEAVDITLNITGPVPAGYPPAITTPELGTLNRGLIRCGVWSDESRTFSGGGFDTYAFRIASPTQLSINLESEDADTYAQLQGPDEAWRDDDGGQGTNSRINAGLAPARYWLHVYTADGRGEGAYTLRITSPDFTAGNADANRSCPSDSQDTTTEGSLDSASAGRIVARRLADGRTEFAWHVEGGERIIPRSRYLPADPPTGRWLNSSEIIVEGVNLGRINVRVRADDGRVEFAFTPAGGERILPRSRYFPSNAEADVWLRSTLIEPGG